MAMFRSPRDVGSRPPTVMCDRKKDDREHSCDFCFDRWDSETEVEIHRNSLHRPELMRLLRDASKHVCRICMKSYENKEGLIEHVKTWHLLSSKDAVRVEREIFICDICCTIFFNKLLIQAHIMISHMSVDKMRTCTECPKCLKLYRLKTIWYHFQGHNIQSVACCKICLTKCKHRKEVLEHVETHNKYLFCDICQYQSKNETYFKKHLSVRHSKVAAKQTNMRWRPYFMPRVKDFRLRFRCDTAFKGLELGFLDEIKIRICVLCREICLGEQSMKDHIQNDHVVFQSPQASHVCSCGETFYTKVLLKHHILKCKVNRGGNDHHIIADCS